MATLLYDGDLILSAAEKQPEMAKKRIDEGLLAAAREIWTSLGGKGGSGGADSAATGTLTQQQNTAIITVLDLFGRAKEAAKRAFKGQETKLTGEFTVGENTPRDLASILKRAKTVRDAYQNPTNVKALKSGGGWIADDTAALNAAIAQVSEIDKQLASFSVEIAGTDARNTAANTFYNNLLTIQSAANNEWPESNSANRATRGDFRLGQFPPPSKKKAAATAGVIKSPAGSIAAASSTVKPAVTPA